MRGDTVAAAASSAKDIVFGLLQRRRYDEALAAALATPASHPDRDALERVAYARMGRFTEAARAGRRHLARSHWTAEDQYRQAQILLRCGLAEEAFAAGMAALSAAPEDWRFIIPVIEAVLTEPALEAKLREAAAPILARHPRVPPPPPGEGVLLANLLPHYAPFIGDHPIYRKFCDSIEPIPRQRPESYGTGLLAGVLDGLTLAFAAVERLMAADIQVGRRATARYIGTRIPCLLVDGGACALEFMPLTMTMGERPYFVIFDFLPNLFYPFSPPEQMTFPGDDAEIYRIIGHELDSPSCLGIIHHCEEAARLLPAAFENPRLAEKCHYVNLPSSTIDAPATNRQQPRGTAPSITLLFTSSFMRLEDGFYMRGGVDVVNAFLELHEEFDFLRLNVFGQIPRSLSPRLQEAIRHHPAIYWRSSFIPPEEYEELLAYSDIFVLPSVATFRNGLVQAMMYGLVPIVSDCHYAAEIVAHETSGLVVRGRRHLADITTEPAGLHCDWTTLYDNVDVPSDPSFFAGLKSALHRLIDNRDFLRELSEYNLKYKSRHEFSTGDAARLHSLIGGAFRHLSHSSPTDHLRTLTA